jgi:hypothetical protein
MYIPKRYGEAKIDSCPFCGAQAYSRTSEGLPVCANHKNQQMPDVKCACGKYLDMRVGKFGPFFICERCGTKNMNQVLEMNPQMRQPSPAKQARAGAYKNEYGQDTFVRSDDPRFEFR